MRSPFLRGICLCLISALLLLPLPSCGSAPSAIALWEMMRLSLPSLPAGQLYRLVERPGEEANIPLANEALLATLFGEGAAVPELSLLEDGAIYLSLRTPCEVAVLLCRRASDVHTVAAMCRRRLDVLSRHWEDTSLPEDAATVLIRGRWVLLVFSASSEEIRDAFRRAV